VELRLWQADHLMNVDFQVLIEYNVMIEYRTLQLMPQTSVYDSGFIFIPYNKYKLRGQY